MKDIYTKYIWNNDQTARYTCTVTYDRQRYTGSIIYERVVRRDGYLVTTHDVYQDYAYTCVLDVLPSNKRHSKKRGEEIIKRFVEKYLSTFFDSLSADYSKAAARFAVSPWLTED
jgi:hypothetical protein